MNTETHTMFEPLQVQLGDRSYEIIGGAASLSEIGNALKGLLKHERVVIITNNPVGSHYGDIVATSLSKAGFLPEVLAIPDGDDIQSQKQILPSGVPRHRCFL